MASRATEAQSAVQRKHPLHTHSTPGAIQTFSLAQKQFCWSGIGIRNTKSADRNMAAHRHSFFQVFFVANGAATHEIGDRIFHATAGSIFFVSPFTVHRVVFPPKAQCWVIYFSARFIDPRQGVADEMAAMDPQLYRLPELAPFVYQPFCSYQLAGPEIAEALARCARIEASCLARGLFDVAQARAELTLLLTLVGRKYYEDFKRVDQVGSAERPMDRRARAAVDFMRANFRRNVTLAEVADQVHLTGTHLTKLLKQETGKSFKQLFDELRLENTKNLLAYTDMPLRRIANDSGFLDQAHFARRFKSYAQVTPGEFRRRHRGAMLEESELAADAVSRSAG